MKHTKQTIIFFLSVLLLVSSVTFVTAQDSTSSATEQSIQDNIKNRVDKIIKEAPAVMGTESTAETTFAVVGTLEKMVAQTLQVRTVDNEIRIVELDKQAVILRDNKQIGREEIELNSWISVTGTVDTNQERVGKRVLVTASTLAPLKRQTLIGTFQTSTTRALTFFTRTKENLEKASYPITTKTTYLNVLSQSIKRTDLKESDLILVVLPESTEATPSAKRVYKITPMDL